MQFIVGKPGKGMDWWFQEDFFNLVRIPELLSLS
jgi:hypothetical protein